MDIDYFHHPRRFPKNAPGPFYTTGHECHATQENNSPLEWCGDCLWCAAPEHEAPELLAPLTNGNYDSYFVRQPNTQEEIDRACMALKVCCVAAFRYGGTDKSIIAKLGNDPGLCDYILDNDGALQKVLDESGEFAPFARKLVKQQKHVIKRKQKILRVKKFFHRLSTVLWRQSE